MIRATVRLQFHRGFGFDDAAALASYFAQLGVSHVYASPILAAQPGSTHGYDTLDPARVNPELGGEAGLHRLVAALRRQGLGLVVDIVPNHVGVALAAARNPWWWDVLARGRRSAYAGHFDVDWSPPDPSLHNKLLLPVLGRPYGEALADGELKLVTEDGEPRIAYFDQRFPVDPDQHERVRAAPQVFAGTALHALLEAQHYRLAWWRTAADSINWRRFFEVTSLAGVRVERAAVFEDMHRKLFQLYGEGLIDGVRVDHVDGLADPAGYCRKLRRRLQRLRPGRAWIVVEKILAPDEDLPADWRVDGSTGYDFMAEAGALLHDGAGAEALDALWQDVTGRSADFAAAVRQARREMVQRNFAAEVAATVRALHAVALADLATRDLTAGMLHRALAELLTHFPVYRLYEGGTLAPLERALEAARRSAPLEEHAALEQLCRWLSAPAPDAPQRRAQQRFRQLTSPLAAKAVEDTAFYRHGRLLSRNEVGSDPSRLALAPAEFHRRCAERARRWRGALLATATHDHKRGEDVRARLAVLSERPGEWRDTVLRWRAMNARHRRDGAPEGADELMLYQMLCGAWPLEDEPRFADRIAAWQLKAVREAKRHGSWAEPDEAYEHACDAFLRSCLEDGGFVAELRGWVERIAAAGAVNSLTQVLLRLTVPGIPDLYQGTERWDFSLVDPDNRRPVDYAARRAALDDATPWTALLEHWRDGRIKQALIRHVLGLRAERAELFAAGDYQPLEVSGARAGQVVAFTRTLGGERLAVVVPLHPSRLGVAGAARIDPAAWQDTRVALEGPWRRLLPVDGPVSGALGDLLGPFPVALLGRP